jgi:hypothetical protein
LAAQRPLKRRLLAGWRRSLPLTSSAALAVGAEPSGYGRLRQDLKARHPAEQPNCWI